MRKELFFRFMFIVPSFMVIRKKLSFFVLAFLCMTVLVAQPTLKIDYSRPGPEIPKSMYGIFFEEINHSGDGALYAELIRNRGFEEHVFISGCEYKAGFVYAPQSPNYITNKLSNWRHPWDIEKLKYTAWKLNKNAGEASYAVVDENRLHPATPHSMRIDIEKTGKEGTVDLVNEGYWGVPVEKGEKYDLRFYVRKSEKYKGGVTARIVSSDDKILAEKKFQIEKEGWQEFTSVLKTSGTDSKASLQLCFDAPGTVWVDYVSLFPKKTFRNRENGLHRDVAQKLADLKPAFIRWPGGCIVEGATIENRVKWKETLGDPMTRRGEWDLWNYRTTMGFGYHEFLQFCEDIEAEAMFVANVGLSCRFRNGDYVDESQLPVYIQDICDAIDYAIGDGTTEWGAKRMKAGHSKPFPLKYVELGNENWGVRYTEIYTKFYNVLKPKYPQIEFISSIGFGDDETRLGEVDMIDPHWYVKSDFFWKNTHLFDNKERGKYKVYVGEYACNQEVGSGNMEAALSEAAFMTGMERNSDLVTMSSYAPLIENSNRRDWCTNMIWVNNEQVIGRSSYYVQQLFSQNRPDTNLKVLSVGEPVQGKVEVIAGYDYQKGETVIKVVNGESEKLDLIFELLATSIRAKGRIITLSAASGKDENSFEIPLLISPQEISYDKFAREFTYNFKPYSLTVLRIKTSL